MLPLPPIRIQPRKPSLRSIIKKVDSYTLWAFNPDTLLDPYRSSKSADQATPPAYK